MWLNSNEELLRQGLSLNDELQRVLARHDAIMSGTPLPETSGGRQGHHTEEAKEDSGVVTPRYLKFVILRYCFIYLFQFCKHSWRG